MSQTDTTSGALTALSIKALHQGITSGQFSVMEVTKAYLDRIERLTQPSTPTSP